MPKMTLCLVYLSSLVSILFFAHPHGATVVLDSDDDCFPYEFPVSTSVFDDRYVEGGRANVENGSYVRQKKEEYKCGPFDLFTCVSYSDVQCQNFKCAPGYSTPYDGAKECTEAICDGKVNSQGACNDLAEGGDYVITRTAVYFHGNGTCTSPDTCSGCAEGFYANGPNCKICPKIANCNHRRCTNETDNYCEWCHHEILPQKYWRGYTNDVDGKRSCQKTCSWRSDSIYCYPGWCENELVTQCNCLQGFSGQNCQNIDDDPTFIYNEVKLQNEDNSTSINNPLDPNNVTQPRDILWTNDLTVNEIVGKITAKYSPALNASIDPPSADGSAHFVTDYKAGLVQGKMTYLIKNGKKIRETDSALCPNISRNNPNSAAWDCQMSFVFDIQIRHGDVITWQARVENGGYVEIMDRENNNRRTRHYFSGQEIEVEYSYQTDAETPYHNGTEPLISPDVSNSSSMDLSWEDWVDDLSGISHYEYLINSITNSTSSPYLTTQTVNVNTNQVTVPGMVPGLYEVIFTCFDIAGNHRSARRIVLFDDTSVIDIVSSNPVEVIGASTNASNWFVQPVTSVTVSWLNHFENTRHIGSGWLEAVQDYPGIERSSKYDDNFWTRTVEAMTHVRGIVEFSVKYEVKNASGVVKQYQDFTVVPDLDIQKLTLSGLTWSDGDSLDITIQAMDVVGAKAKDSVTLYRDSSPPVIQDIWLIKDNVTQIVVHSAEEFSEMMIEWVSYDEHSLLDVLEWRLYDHANESIEHGKEDIAIPYTNASDCAGLTSTYSSDCYCSSIWGCQHKRFQIRPEIKTIGGLFMGKDKGVHDSDYYIEIKATNKANLISIARTKITIDISGPHIGSVNDGLVGQDEVDYQQDLDLNGHWSGFFDRESSVAFYQYGFANRCLDASEFSSNLSLTSDIVQTTSTSATQTTVSTPGTYYLTVIAFNKALSPSGVVCSDGVTIDNSTSSIQEISISKVRLIGGLIADANQSDYWILDDNWSRRRIEGATSDCITKARTLTNIDLIPISRDRRGDMVAVNGSVFCANSSGAPIDLLPMLSVSSMVTLEWSVVESTSGVHDFEVGIATTADSPAPDILAFKSTNQNRHIRFRHADLPSGSIFYFTFKTISKSGTEKIQSLKSSIDTTAPTFTGSISLTLSGNYLIASWGATDFSDPEDPNDLEFEYALGTSAYRADLLSWRSLSGGGPCTLTTPPSCTAVGVSNLHWELHGHHEYNVTVRATNYAGLTVKVTSDPYVHDVLLPSKGVVLDIDTKNVSGTIPYRDIEDIDFQTEKTALAARWSGFRHLHESVAFKIHIGTTPGADDIQPETDVGTNQFYKASGLTLSDTNTYYFTVTALSSVGNVTVTSDGVTIATEGYNIPLFMVYDGDDCTMIADTSMTRFTHHDKDNRYSCATDIEYQSSTSTIAAHWSVPSTVSHVVYDVFFSVEMESLLGSNWSTIYDYEYIYTASSHSVNNLDLSPGRKYRVAVKPCAGSICFATKFSNGVRILSSKPTTGALNATHLDTSGTSNEELEVTFDLFYDPDVADVTRKYSVVDHYEYAITDNSARGNVHTTWTSVNVTKSGNKGSFTVVLNGTMDFSKCRRFALRGYNKAKLWSTVSADIKDCQAFDPILINPRFIVDARGTSDSTDDTKGNGVYLEENAIWYPRDIDYTPFKNVLSAVWHSGRYSSYTWAVVNAHTLDVTTYYKQIVQLNLTDPCSHPDVVHQKCGNTTSEFINVYFEDHEHLVHGERYSICIHANAEVLKLELWDLSLPEISICTDGVIVDLTSPVSGEVWIGNVEGREYQTQTADIYVNWESFGDVEEFGVGRHATGISYYTVSVGSSDGGNDVIDFTDVGVVNHAHFGGLALMPGRKYYATVVGYDFAGRSTKKTSDPVVIDNSPPAKSSQPITLSYGRHIMSKTAISACWVGVFSDAESGIAYYEWAVGSSPGYNDKMAFTNVTSSCASSSVTSPLDLEEGHAYFINVKATNGAGLSSMASSWAYVLDFSPPLAGYVYDGERGHNSSLDTDIDYQTHSDYLSVFWEGFHDPHSSIIEYYVSVGTCQGCQDVLAAQPLGITEEFILTEMNLGIGITYYTTVTACNSAELCSTVTSDGVMVDISPPTPGRVQDGVGTGDIEYQGSGSYIGARWYGFSDPQSALEKYVWKAGTTNGGGEIFNITDLHLDTLTLVTNVSLPVGVRIYITIGCFNRAGLYSQSVSNGFVIDDTPPVIAMGPAFSSDFGVYFNPTMQQYYHLDRTTLKVDWTVRDDVSYIERQYLSIRSHIGGEFSTSSVQVNGIVRYYLFSDLDLHDGVKYYVNLISCNGAGLCANSTSPSIIVDSTPPSRGMFAVQTDHASDLSRHLTTWMTWTLESVSLAWLGFSDLNSGIDFYGFNIGSTFMGNDLNMVADVASIVYHNNSGVDRGDEGILQTSRIPTQPLSGINSIYIHMWAVNKAGLSSQIIHNQFTKAPDGTLGLVRRCSAHTCDGHCVCAPQDQRCPTTMACTNDTDARSNSYIQVTDLLNTGSVDATYSPSKTVLRASWDIIMRQGFAPVWYEWSVGLESETSPVGLIAVSNNRVWFDGGKKTEVTYVTKRGEEMVEGQRYCVFVRVWYDTHTFGDFKSDGVIVQTLEPETTILAGGAVTEVERYSSYKDMDYIKNKVPITISWRNKFLNVDTDIAQFKVYISRYPGGHDAGIAERTLDISETSYILISHNLPPGVRFYSNVVAYTHVGMYVTATSDGFIMDDQPPIMGTVMDGLGLHDIDYQADGATVSARWHGFVDLESSIHHYTWCVGSSADVSGDDMCDVVNSTNVGLHTRYRAPLRAWAPACLYNKVSATDMVGYTSSTAVSDGVCTDRSTPVPEYLSVVYDNLLQNSNFSEAQSYIPLGDLNSTDACHVSTTYEPNDWIENSGSCAVVVESGYAKSGTTFLYLIGSISQIIELDEGLYKLTFVSSHGNNEFTEVANKEGFVQFGDRRQIFLIYTKAYRADDHGIAANRDAVSWHNHTFYFKVKSKTSLNITVGSVVFGGGLYIDDIQLHRVNTTASIVNTKHVIGHVVFLHEWSSVHGSWSFINDGFVDIVDYSWAIGHIPYGTQLQDYTSTGVLNYGYNHNISLVQNSSLFISVIATNSLGRRTVAVSEQIFVDMTPPVISEVNDGTGFDEDVSEISTVFVNWKAEDLDSGIDYCEWAIGYSPSGIEIQSFKQMQTFSGYLPIDPLQTEGHTVYNTIRCTNKAGLTSTKASDGIKISQLAPNSSEATLKHIHLASTQYQPLEGFQGVNNTVKLYWSGFKDDLGISLHVLSMDLSNTSKDVTKALEFSEYQDVKFSQFSNLSMSQGMQLVELYVQNVLSMPSEAIEYNFTLFMDKPEIHVNNTPNVTWSPSGLQFNVTWDEVFTSQYDLRFEVSAGLAEGGAEILQWQETTETELVFKMPSHVDDYSGSIVYIHIRAIAAGGFYSDAKGTVTLPP